MSWYDSARAHIEKVHEGLPKDISFADRKKAIAEAYPFGQRKMHPYKMWLKAQKEYLTKYCPPSHDSKRFPLSPLERMALKSGEVRK